MSNNGMAYTSSNIHNDLSRLQNVFRIISKPQHTLREKAFRLREEISSTWANLGAQGQWFPWPSTAATRGRRVAQRKRMAAPRHARFLGLPRGRVPVMVAYRFDGTFAPMSLSVTSRRWVAELIFWNGALKIRRNFRN